MVTITQSILEYNGGSLVGIKGKDCVAIACDTRLGVQFTTQAHDFQRVFKLSKKCLVGFVGLGGDIQTFHNYLRYRLNLYELRENREMSTETIANFLTTSLYQRRTSPYFIEPIIVGYDEKDQPYVTGSDLIGSLIEGDYFVCAGPAAELLMGGCETYVKPDMNEEELFEVTSQVLLAATDRDAISGWGAVVYLLTKDGIKAKTLKCRMD